MSNRVNLVHSDGWKAAFWVSGSTMFRGFSPNSEDDWGPDGPDQRHYASHSEAVAALPAEVTAYKKNGWIVV